MSKHQPPPLLTLPLLPRKVDDAADPSCSITTGSMMRVPEVAERLQLAERSVRRFIDAGELKVHRFGRVVRVSEADLAAFLAERRG